MGELENKKNKTVPPVKMEASRQGFLSKAFAVALLLPITVVCTALMIYFGNVSELGIDLPSVLKISTVFLVFTAVVLFAVQLPFTYFCKGKGFAFVNAFLLVAGYWFWLQANVFNWNMGPLTGVIPFGQYKFFAYLEIGIWFVGMVLTVVFFRFLFRYSIQFACILALAQVVNVVPLYFKEAQTAKQLKPNFSGYEYTLNHLFDYSQDKDVYVFVLDALGSTIFEEISTEVSYHKEFKDFTFFPKHFVYYPAATKWSIPRILGGIDARDDTYNYLTDNYNSPEQEALFHAVFSQKTLFDDMKEGGYVCRAHSWYPLALYWNPQSVENIRILENCNIGIRNLFAPLSKLRVGRFAGLALFRLLPFAIKKRYHRFLLEGKLLTGRGQNDSILDDVYVPLFLTVDDRRFFRKIQSVQWDSTPLQKQFKFVHLQASHVPYYIDENAEPLANSDQCRQAKGTLKMILSILGKMKKNECYDSSLIVIMSDHGSCDYGYLSTHPAAKNKPLLLVKRPMDQHDTLQINDSPVCLSDTRNAILTELNLPRPNDAFSWFDVPKELAEKRNTEWSAYLNEIEKRQ